MFGLDDMLIAAAITSAVTGVANVGMQWANMDYQRGLQNDIFSREDTSIARRVSDLKASGLSPVLAAGQGAGTGGIVSTKAPEIPDIGLQTMQLISMGKDLAVKDQTIQNLQAQKSLNDINSAIKAHDLKIYKKFGSASTDSGIAKEMRGLLSLADSPVGRKTLQDINDKINRGNARKIPGPGGKQFTPEEWKEAKKQAAEYFKNKK